MVDLLHEAGVVSQVVHEGDKAATGLQAADGADADGLRGLAWRGKHSKVVYPIRLLQDTAAPVPIYSWPSTVIFPPE